MFSFLFLLFYTLLPLLPPDFLQPPCGRGVTSSIMPILNPDLDNARIAACAPGPVFVGPSWPPGALTLIDNAFTPFSLHCSDTIFAAVIAAVGELSILSALTTMPPDALANVSEPVISVLHSPNHS